MVLDTWTACLSGHTTKMALDNRLEKQGNRASRRAMRIISFGSILSLVLYQYAEFTGYFEFTVPNVQVMKATVRSKFLPRVRDDDPRTLMLVNDDGSCEWTAPKRLNASYLPPQTLLVSYPGSGKRMTWRMIEGITGLVTGDDWDLSEEGKRVATMKTSYPHHEGIWSWGWKFNNADVVLLLRNPRWAIPSYQTMRYELGYSGSWRQSYNHIDNTYTNRSSVDEWERWRGNTWPHGYQRGRYQYEIKKWGRFIDFWMRDGHRRYDEYGESVKDWHCRHKVIKTCIPKIIISFENLNDPDLGAFEIDKLLDALEDGSDRKGFPTVRKDSRKCIFRQVQAMREIEERWDNTARDQGISHVTRELTWVQLNMMKEELERLISNYTEPEFLNDPVAEQLVYHLNRYHEAVTAEWKITPPYSWEPTPAPTVSPTPAPTPAPTMSPTKSLTKSPTPGPTKYPTKNPTKLPTSSPTSLPTPRPSTKTPTQSPTKTPVSLP